MFEEIQGKSYLIQLGSNCAAFPGLLPARCRPRRRRRRRGHHPSPKLPAPKPGVGGRDRTGWGGNSLLGVKAKALQTPAETGPGVPAPRGKVWLESSSSAGSLPGTQGWLAAGVGGLPPLGGAGPGLRPGCCLAPGRCLCPGSCCPWHWAGPLWWFLWRGLWSLTTPHAAL